MRIKSIPTIMTEQEEVVIEFKDIIQQDSQENNQNNENNNNDDQQQFYEVEAILQKKQHNNDLLYLVKWKGYTELTWEPHSSLQNCTQLVDEFELKLQQITIENIKKKVIKKNKTERFFGSFSNGDQVSGFSQFGRTIQIEGVAQQQLKVHWKNRKHGKPKSSWVPLKELHKRAPGKLIQFYESHQTIQALFKHQEIDSNESTL